MALKGGSIWGFGRWDGVLWGFNQSGVTIKANISNQEIIDFIAQTNPLELKISFSCTIGGVETNDKIVSFRTDTGVNKRSSFCELIYAGESVTGLTLNSTEIILTITYTFGSTAYSETIFRGKATNILPQTGLASQSVQIICGDSYSGLDLAPETTSYTGNTDELAVYEATLAGVTMLDFNFTSMALSAVTINALSKRILIKDLAGAIEEAILISQPDGSLTATKVNITTLSGWTFPLSNQLSQGVYENTNDRCNKCTVTGSTGETNNYSSSSDISIYGLLEKQITSPFPLSAAQCLLKATAVVNYSIKPLFTFQTILHPWIKCGSIVECYVKKYAATKQVLIENIKNSGSWEGSAGFWGTISGRIIN